MLYANLPKPVKINLAVQSLCMLIGTSTHLIWILGNGIYIRRESVAYISTVFWDSLTFLDVSAAVLLFIRPKTGVLFTLLIITVDVIHNNVYLYLIDQHINTIGIQSWVTTYWMMLCQILFMMFVVLSLKRNLKEIKGTNL